MKYSKKCIKELEHSQEPQTVQPETRMNRGFFFSIFEDTGDKGTVKNRRDLKSYLFL